MGLMELLIVVFIGTIFGWGVYTLLKGLDDR